MQGIFLSKGSEYHVRGEKSLCLLQLFLLRNSSQEEGGGKSELIGAEDVGSQGIPEHDYFFPCGRFFSVHIFP